MLEICCAVQHLKTWGGAQPSYVHCKAMINYFRALEGRNTSASCPFLPQLLLIEPLDNDNICQKGALLAWVSYTVRVHEVLHGYLTFLSSLHGYI